MSTALLLCGGGARGIIQAGMLEYIYEQNIKYDAVYGASVGAINGSLFQANQIQDLLEMWLTIKTSDVYSLNLLTLPFRVMSKDASLFDNTPLKKRLRALIDLEKLQSNFTPFYIRATDVANNVGKSVSSQDANFIDHLIASASPPIAFPPVRMGASILVDGGIYNNFGIDEAIKDGHDKLIVLAPTCPAPNPVKNIFGAFDVLASAPEYALQSQLKMVEINNDRPGKRYIKVILVRPSEPSGIDLLNFDLGTTATRQELISTGYKLAAAKINQ